MKVKSKHGIQIKLLAEAGETKFSRCEKQSPQLSDEES